LLQPWLTSGGIYNCAAAQEFHRAGVTLLLALFFAFLRGAALAHPILPLGYLRRVANRHCIPPPFDAHRQPALAPTPVQGPVAGTAIRVISDRTPTRKAYCSSAV